MGDFQLHFHLAVSFAARVGAAWRCAYFADGFGGAGQTFVDIGVEVGGNGAGDRDVDRITDLEVIEVFRLVGQLHRELITLRAF
ncbi:hypothetical protein D3C84_988160 [compost metagenome]